MSINATIVAYLTYAGMSTSRPTLISMCCWPRCSTRQAGPSRPTSAERQLGALCGVSAGGDLVDSKHQPPTGDAMRSDRSGGFQKVCEPRHFLVEIALEPSPMRELEQAERAAKDQIVGVGHERAV